MRRVTLWLLTILAVVSFAGPVAGSQVSRTVERQYTGPHGVIIGDSFQAEAYQDLVQGLAEFRARTAESSVTLKIKDDLGRPVRGHIHVDRDGDGKVDVARDFCETTPRPLSITPRSKLRVWVMSGTCPDGTLAFATRGTVTAIFRR